MYCITDEQITYILNDIKRNGVDMEDLQLNLLDHICCIVEQELEENGNFEQFYQRTVKRFYKNDLHEIEEETINLLTFKNYYAMKKAMMGSGALSAAAFAGGSLFKIMQWQGASALLMLGMLSFSFVFLPLMMLLKVKEQDSRRNKMILVLGVVTGVLYTVATMFAIFHWPGRTALWLSTVSFSGFIFIPVYFFTGIRKPEAKVNTIVTSVLLIGATGLLFTMIAVRPPEPKQMYVYEKNEQILKNIRSNMAIQTDAEATEINDACDHIKGLILQHAIGQPSLPANWFAKNAYLGSEELNERFYDEGESGQLVSKLRASVDKYNSTRDEAHKIPMAHSVLDATGRGINTIATALNEMTQLQILVATAEPAKAVGMK